MFRRRQKKPLTRLMRDLLWPAMGIKRLLRYYQYRLARHPRSPQELAASMAHGAIVTFIPIPGSHAFITVLLCWLTRLPLVPGLIGTLVGNPWTLPPAWFAAYKLGDYGCHLLGIDNGKEPVSFSLDALGRMTVADFMDMMVPTLLAGMLLAALSWPVFYYVFLMIVREAKNAIILFRKARRRLKEAL